MTDTAQATLELACELIRRPSVTPDDAGCQELLAARLTTMGFAVEFINHGKVTNLWARRGDSGPLLVFAGHTDVVPAGPLTQWHGDPFAPRISEGNLYGRGSADMKGSLAAMLTAVADYVAQQPATGQPSGSIGFLLTSDEEGPAVDGTVRVMETLRQRGERIDWCLVGEPSSARQLGDTVRVGRRGSLSGRLTFMGKQGHVAYPERARNPIHLALPVLLALTERQWDRGDPPFPPTSLQISNIHGGTGAGNVIPGILSVDLNFRYSPAVTAKALSGQVEQILDQGACEWRAEWQHSASPFVTRQGRLIDATRRAIIQVQGIEPELSTGGGTSDGRFIAPTGAEVVELGLLNTTIHAVDEHTPVADLDRLRAIYLALLQDLMGGGDGNC